MLKTPEQATYGDIISFEPRSRITKALKFFTKNPRPHNGVIWGRDAGGLLFAEMDGLGGFRLVYLIEHLQNYIILRAFPALTKHELRSAVEAEGTRYGYSTFAAAAIRLLLKIPGLHKVGKGFICWHLCTISVRGVRNEIMSSKELNAQLGHFE